MTDGAGGSPAAVPPWEELLGIAQSEVNELQESLPPELAVRAREVPVLYMPRPAPEDDLEASTLGLFVGSAYGDGGMGGECSGAHIILCVSNHWEGDLAEFGEEIRRTYLHEVGHYLGLEEDDLEDRGL